MNDAVLATKQSTLLEMLKKFNEDAQKKLDADPTTILDSNLIDCYLAILHRSVADYSKATEQEKKAVFLLQEAFCRRKYVD